MGQIWVIPDLQIPFCDRRFISDGLASCIADNRRDIERVVTIGDELDLQSLGKYVEGYKEQFTANLDRERNQWMTIARELGVTDTIRSNHTDRLARQIASKIPSLSSLPELSLENFMRLPELGIRFHPEGLRVKDWLFIHGDEGRMSQVGGMTAVANTRATGLNICQGHTHRAGLVPTTASFMGRVTRTLWGLEVGHAMDLRKARYVKTHQWQKAFAVLTPIGNTLSPTLIPVIGRRFIYNDKEYRF
jgi:hypothetical protein